MQGVQVEFRGAGQGMAGSWAAATQEWGRRSRGATVRLAALGEVRAPRIITVNLAERAKELVNTGSLGQGRGRQGALFQLLRPPQMETRDGGRRGYSRSRVFQFDTFSK